MNVSTLFWRPHHLNWMVTSLSQVITGSAEAIQSPFKGPLPVFSDTKLAGSSSFLKSAAFTGSLAISIGTTVLSFNFFLVQFMNVFRLPLITNVVCFDHNIKVILHIAWVRQHCLTVRIGIPSLLVYLKRASGGDHLDPAWDLAGEVVDLIGILALAKLSVQQGYVIIRLVFQNFYSFSASSLILRCLGNSIQLGYLVLLHGHGKRDTVLL